nr:EOG090X02H3 [Eulimnadia texana]
MAQLIQRLLADFRVHWPWAVSICVSLTIGGAYLKIYHYLLCNRVAADGSPLLGSHSKIINPMCHATFGLFRLRNGELKRFILQFLPSLIYVYLSGLAENDKKGVSSIGTLLLGIYNLEAGEEADRVKTSAFRLPTLAQPSIYHEPLGLAPTALTETALRRLDPANRVTITWGPQPHIHLFNAENRLPALAALLRIYSDQLILFSKNSLEESCLAFNRLLAQGFTRQMASAPRIAVSSKLLVEIARILYSLTLEDSSVASRARQALEALEQRAEYELLPAPLLVSYACADSAHLSVKGLNSTSALLSSSSNSSSARAMWKSMITNASFRTRKLPDDITVAQDPAAAGNAHTQQQQQQPQQQHVSHGPAPVLGSITEESDEPSNASKFRIPELSNLVKKRDKMKNPDSLGKAKTKVTKSSSGKSSNGEVPGSREEASAVQSSSNDRSNGEAVDNAELRRRSSEFHAPGTLVTQIAMVFYTVKKHCYKATLLYLFGEFTVTSPKKRPQEALSYAYATGMENAATLWNILQKFETNQSLKPALSSCGKEVPVCIYLRQEVSGQEKLQETTLLKLGIDGGKVAIRYLLKSPDLNREQAHIGGILLPTPRPPSPEPRSQPVKARVPVPEPMEVVETAEVEKEKPRHAIPEQLSAPVEGKEEVQVKSSALVEEVKTVPAEAVAAVPSTTSVSRETSKEVKQPEPVQAAVSSSSTIKKRARLEVDERRILLNSRGDLIYSQEEASVSADVRPVEGELADDFFELTVDDLRLLLHDLKKQYTETETPLLTAEMRRSREERRFHEIAARYPTTVLRVQFPDRLTLQIPFQSESTIVSVKETLVEYLEGNLRVDDFYLYTAPPKKVIDLDADLLRGGLTPSAVVYIGSEKVTCRIKQEFTGKLSSYFGAMRDASERLSVGKNESKSTTADAKQFPSAQLDSRMGQVNFPAANDGENEDQGPPRVTPSTGPVPKWFKMKK